MVGLSRQNTMTRWPLYGLLNILALSACGDDHHDACAECTTDGAAHVDRDAALGMDAQAGWPGDGGPPALPLSDAGSEVDAGPTWASGPIRPTRYRLPEPAPMLAPCPAGGAGVVKTHEVLLGQTHLTPSGWPLQTVSASRPLTIGISLTGVGAAPTFTATVHGTMGDQKICLQGPATLASSADDLTQSLFRATVPAAWVAPRMTITIEGAGISETLTPEVKAENGLTLYYLQARLFDEGAEPALPTNAEWTELLARLPVSYLDVGVNPFGIWRPKKLLIGSRDDARTPSGDTTSLGPVIVDQNPHCSASDKAAKTCTPHSGYGTMSGVLSMLDAFREANGVEDASTWYADFSVELGGGLSGGERGSGDNAELVMNHELGHAWGFPHWSTSDTAYPYEGVHAGVSGGFGDRWAFDQARDALLAPTCSGMERQSPMQRAGGSCVPTGSWYDPYSDYEAARLLRVSLGASGAVMGTVPYHGGKPELKLGNTRAFTLPKEDGRLAMRFDASGPGFTWAHYDEASNAFTTAAQDAWYSVAQGELPVTMFAGALIFKGDSYFEEPADYVGNLLGALDPTHDADFATIKKHMSDDFYWAHDAVLRFTLDDQTTLTRILSASQVLRAAGDTLYFALNLPAEVGHRVVKLEVLGRPLGQYDASSRLTASDSAANYLSKATVLATWQRP